MTNPMLQRDDRADLPDTATVLLVAIEMSLKTWRLVMGVRGQLRKRVKTVAGGDYTTVHQAVPEARERFHLPKDTGAVFCYEAGGEGFYPYGRWVDRGYRVWVIDSASLVGMYACPPFR